jgi:mono/diheme cytochrome c family protein
MEAMKLFLALLSCLIATRPVAAEDVTAGFAIVKAECSGCHAVGPTGASPNPKSPPFRNIVWRYGSGNLVEVLSNQMAISHDEMPEFLFEPEEVLAIASYLESLKNQRP